MPSSVTTFDGAHLTLKDAHLEINAGPRVPLLVGGSNRRLLRLGGEFADVVELGGTGRTLADGRYHEARWSEAHVSRDVEIVKEAAARVGRLPRLGALVQFVELTEDPELALATRFEQAAAFIPPEGLPSIHEALTSPYTLMGTVKDIVAKLIGLRERWGFTRFTVRSPRLLAEVIAGLGNGGC